MSYDWIKKLLTTIKIKDKNLAQTFEKKQKSQIINEKSLLFVKKSASRIESDEKSINLTKKRLKLN